MDENISNSASPLSILSKNSKMYVFFERSELFFQLVWINWASSVRHLCLRSMVLYCGRVKQEAQIVKILPVRASYRRGHVQFYLIQILKTQTLQKFLFSKAINIHSFIRWFFHFLSPQHNLDRPWYKHPARKIGDESKWKRTGRVGKWRVHRLRFSSRGHL